MSYKKIIDECFCFKNNKFRFRLIKELSEYTDIFIGFNNLYFKIDRKIMVDRYIRFKLDFTLIRLILFISLEIKI